MHKAEVIQHLNRYVKIQPSGDCPHWQMGIVRAVGSTEARIQVMRGEGGKRVEDLYRDVRFDLIKRDPRANRNDEARKGAIVGAAAAGEMVARRMERAAGIAIDKRESMVLTDKFRERVPMDLEPGQNAELMHVSVKNGVPNVGGVKLAEVESPRICPSHGFGMPCGECARLADAAALAVSSIILDRRSGRVWCGPEHGFIDGAQDPTTAIKRARRMHPNDARRWVTQWERADGSKRFDNRMGQYFPDGLDVFTEEKAMELLTEPGRTFEQVPQSPMLPKLVVKNAEVENVSNQSRSSLIVNGKTEYAAAANPPDAKSNTSADFVVEMMKLTNQIDQANRKVGECEAWHGRAADEAAKAKRDYDDAVSEQSRAASALKAAREAVGSIKVRMMALVEKQGS